MLTRSVGVISSSWFLPKKLCAILTINRFWITSRSLFLLLLFSLKPGQIIVHLLTLYREPANIHKTLYPDGKKCAIPSLRHDTDAAKADNSLWRWRRVTPTNYHRRAVRLHVTGRFAFSDGTF